MRASGFVVSTVDLRVKGLTPVESRCNVASGHGWHGSVRAAGHPGTRALLTVLAPSADRAHVRPSQGSVLHKLQRCKPCAWRMPRLLLLLSTLFFSTRASDPGTGRKQAARTVGIVDIAIFALRAKLRLAVYTSMPFLHPFAASMGLWQAERKPSRS